jgi:hypothetical protein
MLFHSPLPPDLAKQIDFTSNEELLESWLLLALDAPTLDAFLAQMAESPVIA